MFAAENERWLPKRRDRNMVASPSLGFAGHVKNYPSCRKHSIFESIPGMATCEDKYGFIARVASYRKQDSSSIPNQ